MIVLEENRKCKASDDQKQASVVRSGKVQCATTETSDSSASGRMIFARPTEEVAATPVEGDDKPDMEVRIPGKQQKCDTDIRSRLALFRKIIYVTLKLHT